MNAYSYLAKDLTGKNHRGTLAAESLEAFRERVRQDGLYLISYSEQDAETISGYRLNLKELVQFCRQLSTMISAGVTIVRAIDILYMRQNKPKVRKRLSDLFESVQKGSSLSEAMEEQYGTFPPLLVNMIRSGETSGTLDSVMLRMSDHYDKEQRLNNKIHTAMIYPIILVVMCLLVVIGLFTFIMPSLFSLFGDGPLPLATRIVVSISNFLLNRWYVLALVLCGGVLLGAGLYKLSGVRYSVDHLKLTLPLFGKLNRTVYTSRLARTLSSLYASGVSMIESIQIISGILGNAYIAKQLDQVMEDLRRGDTLSSAIAKTSVFDPMLFSMIYIGEESGALDQILDRTAIYFDEEAETAISRMVAAFEPMMIIFMGLVVALIVFAVAQSMYGSLANVSASGF